MVEGTLAEPSAAVPVRSPSAGALDEHRGILEGIATGVPMPQTLERVVRLVEAQAPGVRASVLLVQSTRLVHGAAPSLPAAYNRAIDGLGIAVGAGSCGTAAATGAPVVVEDVRTHPYWAPFRDLAAEHGVRACWSTPIHGRGGETIGTFAMYPPEARGPRPEEERVVAQATHIASIAIQHDRLLRSEAARLAELEKRTRLREFLQRAPMPVALLDGPEFTFSFVNPAYEELVQRKGLEGRRLAEAFPELESQGMLDLMRGIYESGEAYTNPELRVELDRGRGLEEAWFSVRIEPYTDEDGLRGLLAIGMETTGQVKGRLELDRRRAQLATREKTSALGQLVSGVAHEIRTPLTYLATNLNIIQLRLDRLKAQLPRAQAESVEMLVDQYIPSALEGVDRIAHIVEDLRGFTQAGFDEREPVLLDEVVGGAVSLFQATHRGRVEIRYAPAPGARVTVDKLQVQQALLNLLQNALEAHPRDHAIGVRATVEDAQAVVEVSDQGEGIPPDVQARLFDPFYTTKAGGTGLGLSIVKRIAEDHGGRVTFDTGPSGTTFRLALPLPR